MKGVAKFHAAEEQLYDALCLCMKGRFISAIALAGAAEEVFSKHLIMRGESTALDDCHRSDSVLRQKQGRKFRSKNEIAKQIYKLRNNLKHMDIGVSQNSVVDYRLYPDGISQLLRAIQSYEKLKKKRQIPARMRLAISDFRELLWKEKSLESGSLKKDTLIHENKYL